MSLTYRWPILGCLRDLRVLSIACKRQNGDSACEGSAIFQASGCRFTASDTAANARRAGLGIQSLLRIVFRTDFGRAVFLGECAQKGREDVELCMQSSSTSQNDKPERISRPSQNLGRALGTWRFSNLFRGGGPLRWMRVEGKMLVMRPEKAALKLNSPGSLSKLHERRKREVQLYVKICTPTDSCQLGGMCESAVPHADRALRANYAQAPCIPDDLALAGNPESGRGREGIVFSPCRNDSVQWGYASQRWRICAFSRSTSDIFGVLVKLRGEAQRVYKLGRISGGWYLASPTSSTFARCTLFSPSPALDAANLCHLDWRLRLLERSRNLSLRFGRKNAKSASTAPRSAPVALADRRDDVWGRTGGSGLARVAARSAAALQCCKGRKIGKSTSNALRSAREVLVDGRDCRGVGRGGAQRRHGRRRHARLACLLDAFSARSRPISAHVPRIAMLILLKDDLGHARKQQIFVGRARAISICIAVRRARILLLRFPCSLTVATLLVLKFATLFELPVPPATPSILVSTNFNTPRGRGADAHSLTVADVEGISSALPLAPFSTPRGRLGVEYIDFRPLSELLTQ
ncbi:hypothetical protein EV121DRAFT_268251 [Schizophyllum commune]